jgi:hypothetical protein
MAQPAPPSCSGEPGIAVGVSLYWASQTPNTFGQSGLPAQTAFWESATVPAIYFAGTISQGAAGLKKYGVPSNSGAVHGHRYNARVLAGHIARRHFGIAVERRPLEPAAIADQLLDELSGEPGHGADIFHQRSYLARVIGVDNGTGVYDDSVQPLTHFLDVGGLNAIASTLETNTAGEIYPAVYVRRDGAITETILESDVLLDFRGEAQRKQLAEVLRPLLGAAVS